LQIISSQTGIWSWDKANWKEDHPWAGSDFWCKDAWLHEEPLEILVVNSTSSGAYASLCRESSATDTVAFDAEWVPDFAQGSDNPISVLQFAFPQTQKAYVVQLGQLGKLPIEVQMMLVNPEVTKVGFGVDARDAEKLRRTSIAMTADSVIDVQRHCAALLGFSSPQSLGLRRAAECLLGQAPSKTSFPRLKKTFAGYRLQKDKRCTCSDWSVARLSAQQVRYAALDAWVALRLFYTCMPA